MLLHVVDLLIAAPRQVRDFLEFTVEYFNSPSNGGETSDASR